MIFKWFKRTSSNYTTEQMEKDHEATVREIFGSDYVPAPLDEQLSDAEEAVERAGMERDNNE